MASLVDPVAEEAIIQPKEEDSYYKSLRIHLIQAL